jgi:hypothetical protein
MKSEHRPKPIAGHDLSTVKPGNFSMRLWLDFQVYFPDAARWLQHRAFAEEIAMLEGIGTSRSCFEQSRLDTLRRWQLSEQHKPSPVDPPVHPVSLHLASNANMLFIQSTEVF